MNENNGPVNHTNVEDIELLKRLRNNAPSVEDALLLWYLEIRVLEIGIMPIY